MGQNLSTHLKKCPKQELCAPVEIKWEGGIFGGEPLRAMQKASNHNLISEEDVNSMCCTICYTMLKASKYLRKLQEF